MDKSTLWSLLREVNYKGREGKRIIGIHEIPITAAQDERERYVVLYDNGLETAAENW